MRRAHSGGEQQDKQLGSDDGVELTNYFFRKCRACDIALETYLTHCYCKELFSETSAAIYSRRVDPWPGDAGPAAGRGIGAERAGRRC